MIHRKTLSAALLLSACHTAGTDEVAPLTATTRAAVTATCGRYIVTDLGLAAGANGAVAGIDDTGVVAGVSSVGVDPRGFVWSRGDGRQELGTLGGASSFAYGVGGGRVVGASLIDDDHSHAFVWEGGVLRDLGTLGGTGIYDQSIARGINSDGVAVGSSRTPAGNVRAVRFEDGEVIELGGDSAEAWAINDAGVAVGTAGSWPRQRAVAWIDGEIVSLGTLGTASSFATAVNEHGDAAGHVDVGTSSSHPVLYRDGEVVDLGVLPGFDSAHAYGINDAGLVVGRAIDYRGQAAPIMRCFVSDGTTLTDLNSVVGGSGWLIVNATGINERGQIAAVGTSTSNRMGTDRQPHALVLTPECEGPVEPTLRDVSVAVGSSTVAVPATKAAGDLMLAAIEYCGDPVELSPPSGWTLVADQRAGEGTDQVFHALVYAHEVTGDEPTEYVFDAPAGVYVTAQVAAYGGVTAVASTAAASAFGTSIEAPGLDAPDGGLLVALFVDYVYGSWSEAPGLTRRTDVDSNSLQDALVGAGSTGPRVATNDGEGALAAVSVLLR
jgi:probable HAF family extracellular repeat protein